MAEGFLCILARSEMGKNVVRSPKCCRRGARQMSAVVVIALYKYLIPRRRKLTQEILTEGRLVAWQGNHRFMTPTSHSQSQLPANADPGE